jgi:hypothetical protein
MVTYHDYAKDLRALADLLDTHTSDLPLPKHANQGLTIAIHTAEAIDVVQAAKTLGVEIEIRRGHTTADVEIDTVHLGFIHINGDAMAEFNLRQAYAKTMPAAVGA